MKRVKSIMSTTHVDSDGDVMTLGALKDGKSQIDEWFVPIDVEHDPRIAPIGRIVAADVTRLEDGQYALVGTVEMFEPGDPAPPFDDRKTIRTRFSEDCDPLFVQFDRSYRDDAAQQVLADIGAIVNSKPREYVKKAAGPISVLTIGGSFILGAVAGGFFKELGADAYRALKAKIASLLLRHAADDQPRLLEFLAVLHKDGRSYEVSVILTDPKESDLEWFWSDGLRLVDEMAPKYLTAESKLQRLVLEMSDRTLKISHGVRCDCVPVFPNNA